MPLVFHPNYFEGWIFSKVIHTVRRNQSATMSMRSTQRHHLRNLQKAPEAVWIKGEKLRARIPGTTNGASEAGEMDQSSETADFIRDINLSYIMLAQRMLHEDKAIGMFRLGLSTEVADLLGGLSLAQCVKLASSDQLLCGFRFNEHAMLVALTQTVKSTDVAATHAAILLAGQPVEQYA